MLFLVFVLSLIIVGCSDSKLNEPKNQFDNFLKKWEETDFSSMYNLLTNDAKTNYDEEAFIDRYEKIYNDLGIKDITIKANEVEKKQLKKAKKDKEISIPLEVKLDSVAGEISFKNEMTLLLTEEEDKGDTEPVWLVDWNPSFIYPGMEKDGKISISSEEPKRGEIIDKNRMPLALNDTAYEIGIVPDNFEDESSEKEEIARLLGISTDSIDKALEPDWIEPEHFIPLTSIPKSSEDILSQLIAIPAVQTKDTQGRNYPLGKAAAHLTGYVGPISDEELKEAKQGIYADHDIVGKSGLEKIYEEKLRGEKGYLIEMTIPSEDEAEDEVMTLAEKEVENGEHIQLTIDVNVQEEIYNTYDNEDVSGTAAAIHPKTGEILALISSPGYDPNELIFGISESRWDSLMDDPKEPFLNRFNSTYAPGSVFKPITSMIGLKEGSITHDEGLTINGLKWGKENWNNIKVTRVSDPGIPIHLKEALTYSDNIYYAQKALDIGNDNFVQGLKDFGFETSLPIELPPNQSTISNSGDLKDEILLANTSYGQGEIEMSSLHLALAYTPILNKGDMVKPSLLKEDKTKEAFAKDLVSEDDAEKLQKYLREVVADGTAKSAKDDDLAISGKTGTAELKATAESGGHQNGWFVGYPTDDTDILIAMMMEHTENRGTSSFVAKNVKDILLNLE